MDSFAQIEIQSILIILLPLIGFLILGLTRGKLSQKVAGIIGSGSILISFILSIIVFNYLVHHESLRVDLFPFLKLGEEWTYFSLWLDHLNIIYLLVITGVGFLIHVYSTAYMHDETKAGFSRYFAYLNLFIFSMLMLVMGANYVITFIGWEGVGLCSYLLIGFWFRNIDYTKAAQKAFVMNRIGDLGLLAGMFMIYTHTGTLDYVASQEMMQSHTDTSWYSFAAFFILLGATGKSAQIPLFTWLPDAMAGPTPVSALIHAATMVTAGIFLISRSFIIFDGAADIQHLVMWVGAATAFIAATIATQQNDIKKVLAYSTVSQLGFMFVALGAGAYTVAIFHVVTHAFFKALLFLGSGSVIHAMDNEQDMKYMGGLMKKMPITGATFWVGCLAIAGIPFFSGFFSKDEILLTAFSHDKVVWVVMAISALLTAYYMFRALFLTFYGKFRGSDAQAKHVHESPPSMTVPLVILAILAAIGGALNIPEVLGGSHWLQNFICTSVSLPAHHDISHSTELILMGLAVLLSIIGIFWARANARNLVFEPQNGLAKFFRKKWHIDEFYDTIIVKPIEWLADFLNNKFDVMLNGLVNGVGAMVPKLANRMRYIQSGKVGYYLFAIVCGVIALLLVVYFTLILNSNG